MKKEAWVLKNADNENIYVTESGCLEVLEYAKEHGYTDEDGYYIACGYIDEYNYFETEDYMMII